jgi:hypothetical protein
VAFVPGTNFYPEGGHHNTLRLNFSNSTLAQIKTGIGITQGSGPIQIKERTQMHILDQPQGARHSRAGHL